MLSLKLSHSLSTPPSLPPTPISEGADCLEDACLQPGCLGNVNFRPSIPGSTWSRQNQSDGSIAFRVTSCPAGHQLIRSGNNVLGDDCQTCPVGQFGLQVSTWTGNESEAVCKECSPGVNCSRGGRNVSPRNEFWMNPYGVLENPQSVPMHDARMKLQDRRQASAPSRLQAFRCAPGACLSNWTCREGHEGRLCALCQDTSPNGNFYAMGANGCVECEGKSKAIATVIVVLCVIFALLAYYLAVWSPLIGSQTLEWAVMFLYKSANSALDSLMRCSVKNDTKSGGHGSNKDSNFAGYCKIVIGFCQVTFPYAQDTHLHTRLHMLYSKHICERVSLHAVCTLPLVRTGAFLNHHFTHTRGKPHLKTLQLSVIFGQNFDGSRSRRFLLHAMCALPCPS